MQRFNFKIIHSFDMLTISNRNHVNHFCESRFSIMNELKQHRDTIDSIDRQIAELLGKRFRIAEEVAEIKKNHNIPVRIEKRINEVLSNADKHEKEFDLPPRLGHFLWREIIEATCYHEEQILGVDTFDDTEEEI